MTYPGNNIDGWMFHEELQWLYGQAMKMKNVVEIGSWMGRSTHALLSGCPGTVYAVDHFKGSPTERETNHKRALTEDIYSIFKQNMSEFKNLVTLKLDSIEASKIFAPKGIDMVFIDGEHTYDAVKADIETWMPKCRKLLCGHDGNEKQIKQVFSDLNLKPKCEVASSIWSIEL